MEKEKIAAIVESADVGKALSDCFRSALEQGCEEELTAIVIKAADDGQGIRESSDVITGEYAGSRSEGYDYGDEKNTKMSSLAAGIIACILCLAIGLAVGYTVLPDVMDRLGSGSSQDSGVSATAQPQYDEEGQDVLLNGETGKSSGNKNKSDSKNKTKASAKKQKVVKATESDTLWSVANRYCKDTTNETLSKVAKASGMKSMDDIIRPGDEIVIPADLLK